MIILKNTVTQEQINRSPWLIKFDTVTHADYTTLLDYMLPKIDEMYGTGWRDLDTWEKAIKLRNFIRRWGDKGWFNPPPAYTGQPYTIEQVFIPEIIAFHEGGSEGFCSWYSTIYMHLCLALGIHVRRIGWRTASGGGDQITEVYHPVWKKWVWMSPLFNRWYTSTDSNGIGIGTIEMHEMYHRNEYAKLIPQYDGYEQENPVTDGYTDFNLWIFDHAYTIQMFNADGYRFSNGEWSVFTYTDPAVAPLAGAFTQNPTSDKAVWGYDVGALKIGAAVSGDQMTVNVLDYMTPNFKHFKYDVYKKDVSGEYNLINTSTTSETALTLSTAEPGDYMLEMHTVNQRGGEGTISSVSYTVALEGSIILPKVYVWTSNEWSEKPVKVWDGGQWKEEIDMKVFK